MFGVLYGADGASTDALVAIAGEFSPRFEVCGPKEISLDLRGLERLFGDARTIGQEMRRTAADRGLRVRVAIAGTRTAARLLVRVGSGQWAVGSESITADCRLSTGVIVIEPGTEAASLASLPIERLAIFANPEPGTLEPGTLNPELRTFRHWGLRTVGELAVLPADAVAARLGQNGVHWQRLARGDDPRPLLPALPEERFEQALDLEWPIEGLEPLSFVLGRLMEPLSAHLERRGRGAAVLHVRLHLVTRAVHERSLQLPAPMRDARTLRTLALLDLESHPPSAAIDRVVVAVDPTPGRVLQFSLLARPLPSPEQLSTLMARLHALLGQDRCGSPVDVDSWQPGAFTMKPFTPRDSSCIDVASGVVASSDVASSDVASGDVASSDVASGDVASGFSRKEPAVALRRFRFPVPARVRVDDGKPSRVGTDRRGLTGGDVEMCAGPWRTSGGWWGSGPTPHPWDRDEWDVTLGDGATYRLFRERGAGGWFIDGIVD